MQTFGTLTLQPALEHPDLLGAPVREALASWEHAGEVLVAEIDPDLADTAAMTEAYDVPLDASANCVVVMGRRGGEERTAACVVRADTRADVNNVVQAHARRAQVPPSSTTTARWRRPGWSTAGSPRSGIPGDWRLLVDASVADIELAIIGSGIRGLEAVPPRPTPRRCFRAPRSSRIWPADPARRPPLRVTSSVTRAGLDLWIPGGEAMSSGRSRGLSQGKTRSRRVRPPDGVTSCIVRSPASSPAQSPSGSCSPSGSSPFVVLGSFAGKLTEVQNNEASSWLPGNAESTRALEKMEPFQDPNAIPTTVVYEKKSGLTPDDLADAEGAGRRAAGRWTTSRARSSARSRPRTARPPRRSSPTTSAPTAGTRCPASPRRSTTSPTIDGGNVYIAGAGGQAVDSAEAFEGLDSTLLLAALGVVILLLLLTYRSPILWILPIFSVDRRAGHARWG